VAVADLARGGSIGGHISWLAFAFVLIALVLGFLWMRRHLARARRKYSAYVAKPDAAGWYPDPGDPTLVRYYDGQRWTQNSKPRE
jgi:hypothetical protein